MLRVSLLIPEQAVLASIVDPRTVLEAVNTYCVQRGLPPRFALELVGLQPEIRFHNGLFAIRADATLVTATPPDLVLIPALLGDMDSALAANAQFLPWIRAQYAAGAEVASLCLGAFLLAQTGLLEGKKCSTHWSMAARFRTMFPDVTLTDDKIIVEQNGLYSSGGAHSYWNLLLYLLEKYIDRPTAVWAAKYFAVDIDRTSQSAFIMFQGQKAHTDDAVRRAQDFIENNVADRISVDELADRAGVGRRSFERRFKKATYNTVVEYSQRVKMEAAKNWFETSQKTIGEVMFDVGYTDAKAFRDVFKKVTAMTPADYRNKYCKAPEVT